MMTRFLLHNLILPAEEETDYIGVWGQRRLNYLKHHRKVLYYNLLTSSKITLAEFENWLEGSFPNRKIKNKVKICKSIDALDETNK